MTDGPAGRRRFSELLPFFINQTLNAEDQQWMEDYLVRHPEARHEQRFMELLREVSTQTVSTVPEAQRLQRLLSGWTPTPVTLWQRVKNWSRAPVRVPAAALATLAMLLASQAVLVGSLMHSDEQAAAWRGEKLECRTTPRIRVVFQPDAKHVEVVLLLRKLELTVQEGPTETGEFWLAMPPGRSAEEAQAMLRTSALVEEAIVSREARPTPGCKPW